MRRTIAVAVMATLLLTACRGGPEPKEPDPTKSASPSTSSTKPTPAPPTLPPQARKNTPEGAVAFALHWVKAFNHASSTGDTDPLSRASSKSCKACRSYVQTFERVYARGGYFRGGHWKLNDFEVEFDKRTASVFARLKAEPPSYKASATATPHPGERENVDLVFDLRRSDRSWRVTRVSWLKS